MDSSMKEHKARGRKHVKNKVRYKDKSKTAALELVKPKIELENNWDRYKPLDDDAGANYAITDFNLLANAPSSIGSHFQFKSDKVVTELNKDNFLQSDLFTIDLDLLNASLNTLSFNKRYEIDEIFTEEEHKLMDKKAEDAAIMYKHLLLNANHEAPETKSKTLIETLSNPASSDNKLLHCESPVSGEKEKQVANIETKSFKQIPENCIIQKDKNLEKWLDEFLDD